MRFVKELFVHGSCDTVHWALLYSAQWPGPWISDLGPPMHSPPTPIPRHQTTEQWHLVAITCSNLKILPQEWHLVVATETCKYVLQVGGMHPSGMLYYGSCMSIKGMDQVCNHGFTSILLDLLKGSMFIT